LLLRTVSTPVIRPDEWSYVTMVYRPGASEIIVSVDGVERTHDASYPLGQNQSHSGTGKIVQSDANVRLGYLSDVVPDSFYGDLDEVKVAAFVQDDPYQITDLAQVSDQPEGERFVGQIVFDNLGRALMLKLNTLGQLEPVSPMTLQVRLLRAGVTGVPPQWIVLDPSGNVRVESSLTAAPTPTSGP